MNPKNAFNLNIIERSRMCLEKQIGIQERAIIEAVKRGTDEDIEYAKYKIGELKDLATIFNKFEGQSGYQKRLEAVLA